MTVEQLKRELEYVPNDFTIGISVNEEGSRVNHLFIDSDSGYVEFSDFIEGDENLFMTFRDKFNYWLNVNDHILISYNNDLKCGTIQSITAIENSDNCNVEIKFREGNIVTFTFSNLERNKNIIKFNW